MVDHWLRRIQQTLWPATCVLCGGDGRQGFDLCSACEADLPRNSPACGVCSRPLEAVAAAMCGACLRRPARFDASCMPFRYDYPLEHLIRGFKFHRDLASGRVLGDLLARHVLADRSERLPEAVVPVPLATRRYRERGYNQATELALRVRDRTGIPLRLDLARRTRDTREQATLNRVERRKNVRGAFAVRSPLRVRHVAIIDDVVTTGSTVNELAQALRGAGAQRIEVWAVARR